MCICIALWDPVTRLKVPFQLCLLGTCSLLRSLHLYFLFACVWFERWRAVKGLSSKRSLHMSPIGGVWLGARPKLTELCLFLLLALILPPVRGPGGPGEGRWKTARGSTADNSTKFASFTGSYKDSASEAHGEYYTVISSLFHCHARLPPSLPPALSDLPHGRFSSSPVLTHLPTLTSSVCVCECLWHLGTSPGICHVLKGRRENEHLSHLQTTAAHKLARECNVLRDRWCHPSLLMLKVLTHLIDSFLLLVQLHIRLTLTACNFCLKVGYIDLIFFFFLHVANIRYYRNVLCSAVDYQII